MKPKAKMNRNKIPPPMNDLFPYCYRPFFLRDFYFDDLIRDSIQGMIAADKLHLLIQGEPNTGKTSLLYAILREYYQWAANDPIPENQVLFVNNLKEQGITFFRQEIKSFCQMCSSLPHRKKIVVIDDLDIINAQCQQILCNYMDKYENHIHFLFACCNVQKVIEGLQSRTFGVILEPPKTVHMVSLYTKIIEQENLQSRMKENERHEIRDFLIRNANGNLRELINCLGKIMVFIGQDQPINLDMCKCLFLTRIYQSFTEYLQYLRQGKLHQAIQVMNSILTNGYSIIDIFDYFFKFLKTEVDPDLLNETETYKTIQILCSFIHIVHTTHEDNMELVLFTNRLYRSRALRNTYGFKDGAKLHPKGD